MILGGLSRGCAAVGGDMSTVVGGSGIALGKGFVVFVGGGVWQNTVV